MSNTNSNLNLNIVDSWSLMAFAMSHGKMHVKECIVKNDKERLGEIFKMCFFENPNTGKITWVRFSRNLGELTPTEIAARKDSLQVVELVDGKFSLCQKGSITNAEEVDLGL